MFILASDREDIKATGLSNDVLIQKLKSNVLSERKLKASFLGLLSEVDARMLYAHLGYSSLFEFCIRELALSEATALKRIQVARAARRFPILYTVIESGKMTVTALSKLVPHLTSENAYPLLKECEKQSVRQVEKILAHHFPETELSDSIRRGRVKTLTSQRSSIQFSASNAFIEKLESAKDLLSHKYPEQRLEDIFGEALDLLLEKHTPKTEKYVSSHDGINEKNTRYIPRFIRGQVWERDQAQCTYVSPNGRRCSGKAFLEYDHKQPFAHGGSSHEPGNVRLLCSNHNKFLARQVFPWAWEKAKVQI